VLHESQSHRVGILEFGSSPYRSTGIYISFDGLVTWITKNVRLIPDLWTYMDDSFRIDEYGNTIWYQKYEKHMPESQVKLLSLWDELGIPHELHKQLFRTTLTIIGIEVNANSLTFTLPKQALDDLLQELYEFMSWPERKRGASWTLRWWQRLAGWMNWCFNVFPTIHPALNNMYLKITGKDQSLMKIWVNNNVQTDLKWAMGHLCNSLGVHLLSSVTWNIEDTDETIFCDTCLDRLAFWYPTHHRGFFSPVPPHLVGKTIFFYEVLAATSTFDNLQGMGIYDLKVVVYTDSMNTIQLSSLSVHFQPPPTFLHGQLHQIQIRPASASYSWSEK